MTLKHLASSYLGTATCDEIKKGLNNEKHYLMVFITGKSEQTHLKLKKRAVWSIKDKLYNDSVVQNALTRILAKINYLDYFSLFLDIVERSLTIYTKFFRYDNRGTFKYFYFFLNIPLLKA